MSNIILATVLLPLLTALCCLFFGRASAGRRGFVAVSACAQLALALWLAARTIGAQPMVLLLGGWSAPIGIAAVVDGLAAIMLSLSTAVGLACILFSYLEIPVWSEHPLRLPLTQLLIAGINLTFITGDLFNLFVAFEIMLVASYALLTLEANDRHIKEAFPYLAVNIFGSGIFLVAAGLAYCVFGTLNLAQISERSSQMAGNFSVVLVAILLMVVFGIKAGIFPLYYWLPNSYPILPFSLGALYSGMLTKVGIYVILRMFCSVFPHDLIRLHGALAWLAGLTMVLAVLGAISRNFIRGILSFHIVSQIGYMVLAIGLFTPLAIAACIFYVIHHIVVKSSLFLIGGTAFFNSQTDNLACMGGLWKTSPFLTVCFLLQALSLAGIPPLSGFWGKYIIIFECLGNARYWLAGAALLASVLTLVSMLKIWLGAFWKDAPSEQPVTVSHSTIGMTAIVGTMTLVSLGIGLGAGFFLSISDAAAKTLLDQSLYRQVVLQAAGKGGR
jgi:multicomponent Na+:H+ antiporter subunit D